MAACAYCNSTILFGGERLGDYRFCNAECRENGIQASVAEKIPREKIRRSLLRVHRGNCPECDGEGPVDVYTSYRIWSIGILTTWSSRPLICCRTCGIKKILGDTAFSGVLGWWGFPWGVLMTPVQIIRNVLSLVQMPDPEAPTPTLERIVRLQLATAAYNRKQRDQVADGPEGE